MLNGYRKIGKLLPTGTPSVGSPFPMRPGSGPSQAQPAPVPHAAGGKGMGRPAQSGDYGRLGNC